MVVPFVGLRWITGAVKEARVRVADDHGIDDRVVALPDVDQIGPHPFLDVEPVAVGLAELLVVVTTLAAEHRAVAVAVVLATGEAVAVRVAAGVLVAVAVAVAVGAAVGVAAKAKPGA